MSELGGEEQFGYWEAFFWPLLGVAFIFIPPCDPLFFFKVINVFFIFDLPLFLPDPHSMVSGNAIVVPGAFKESAHRSRSILCIRSKPLFIRRLSMDLSLVIGGIIMIFLISLEETTLP